ncbi:MAG: hypothetical protein DCF15_12430 [Phormidesmis priestleyi]|uniref:Uncharacterized protein n=1 Tax=Phormidesmis priestleyi TaxID=268141 RepID=A0A2W4XD88_9CYAN|nr:MAG: hypothetical protein DCF15_12430 [Phormidesmis priestleyi]
MFLLTPEDIEITQVQHPKKASKVPILSYQGQTFRLLSIFSAQRQTEAQAAWRQMAEGEGKLCVLLEEPFRYSLWRQVRIDMGRLHPVAPVAYAQACVLLAQSLYRDVEQLLGAQQAKKFGAALEISLAQELSSMGGLGGLLRVNPLSEKLPQWAEDDLRALLLHLHRLAAQFFGRNRFVSRALLSLDDLPEDDKAMFLSWVRLSLLGHLWLE